jgi:hypothetical protein
MAYGHINSLIVLVDIEEPIPSPIDEEPSQLDGPNLDRIKKHLTQWSDTALDAVFGFLTAETLNYVCLFINKADLLKARDNETIKSLFRDLERLLRECCRGVEFRVYVGSVREGEQVNRLEDDLLSASVGAIGADNSAEPRSISSTLTMVRTSNG